MASTPTMKHITELAHQFSVCYEVWPESAVPRDHTTRQVGFCLELHGRDGDGSPLSPGDDRSKEIYCGLREIAMRVVPEEKDGCRYKLGEFDASLHYAKSWRSPATVQLGIHILHNNGSYRTVDASETRALRETEDRLKNLGIYRR